MKAATSNVVRQSVFLLVVTLLVSLGVASCAPSLVPLQATSWPPGKRILAVNTDPEAKRSEPLLTLSGWEAQWPEVMATWRPGDPIFVVPGPEAKAVVRRLRRELGLETVQLSPEGQP